MALSCGSRMAKCILFVFNVVFWLAGACLLGIGIWFLADENASTYLDAAQADEDRVRSAAICLVVIGVIIFITGGLGCLGAIRESTCMLTMYAVILVCLLVLQVAAGILTVVFRNDILSEMEESMNTTVYEKYGQEGYDDLTDSWNFMQYELECCGVSGPAEWSGTAWAHGNNTSVVPDTCCVLANDDYKDPEPVNRTLCYAAANDPSLQNGDKYIHYEGCHDAFEDWINEHAGILIGVAFGLLAIQIIGIILACCLRKSIESDYKYV